MTDNEKRFIEEYPVDRKGTPAAIRAGYEPSRAKQTAYDLLQKPEIRAAIDERLKVLTIGANEATKNISDIASTRLQDFMTVRQVQGYELTEQYVTVLLEHVQNDIETLRQFIKDEGYEKKGGRVFKTKIQKLQQMALEYQGEIDRFGKDVTRLAPGRPCVIERVELDTVKLAKAKSLGNIQEWTPTEHGPKVKLYAADKANELILKLNGRLIDRHDINNGQKSFFDFMKDAYIDDSTDE